MSLNSLHIASSSLLAAKLQVEITSRNISGAQDPNYTRQTALVKNVGPAQQRLTNHTHGLGVIVEGFERTRDALLDKAFRSYHTEAEGARSIDSLAERLESTLGEGAGLTEAAQDVRLSLLEVANRPDDQALRADLFQKMEDLTERFRSSSRDLSAVGEESQERLQDKVGEFNSTLAQLADLNKRMPAWGKTSGKNALLDERDALMDKLSGIAEVRFVEQQGGAMAVYLDGRQILFGDHHENLTLNSDNQLLNEAGQVLEVDEGSLGALVSFQREVLPGFQSDLDTMAQNLMADLNAVHRVGYGLDGGTGRDLFSGTGALDIKLAITDSNNLASAAARLTSPDRIYTGSFSADNTLAAQSGSLNVAPATTGQMNVNGNLVTWSDGESLAQILDKFNGTGVIAEFDEATGKVILQRDPTVPGPPDITVSDNSGNLSQILGLDTAVSTPAIPGDGSVLRSMQNTLDNTTRLEDRLIAMRTGSGTFRRTAQNTAARAGILEEDAQGRRDSVHAVSTDEELLKLERYQQSFAAAARVATVADEILSTVINLGRN